MNEPDTHKLDYQTRDDAGRVGVEPPTAREGCAAVLVGTVCLSLAGALLQMVIGTWELGRVGRYEGMGTAFWVVVAVPFVLVALGLLVGRVRPFGVWVFVLGSLVALVGMVVVRLIQLRSY